MTLLYSYLAVFVFWHTLGSASLNPCKWFSDCFARSYSSPVGYLPLLDEQNKPNQLISPLPPAFKSHAEKCKKILNKHEIFKVATICATLLEYVGDSSFVPLKTLQQDMYIPSGRYGGAKAFVLPIVQMNFSADGSQLHAVMSFNKNAQLSQYIVWDVYSGGCLINNCKPYWDVEIECVRPPKHVQAVSPDGALKAIVINDFYPHDQAYPAPGNGAYRPQYETVVQLQWSCTLKQFMEYMLLGMKNSFAI